MVVISQSPVMNQFSYRFIKRAFDIIISFTVLLILLPLFIVIGLLIKITSRGPILHRYQMVGCEGKIFEGQKFRSMIINAHEIRDSLKEKNEMNGPAFKIKDDPRITKLGSFIRRYSLDEFPQLWNVLKGDMSIVGPRPPGPYEVAEFKEWHYKKLTVKPGITSTWVINNKPTNFDEWVKLDIWYINHWSLLTDFSIILKTIPIVIMGRNH